MMTIDEAIEREKRLAKENEDRIGEFDEEYSEKCKMWAYEHNQIAEWLEELKALREKDQKLILLTQKEFDVGTQYTYNKAIDDFCNKLCSNGAIADFMKDYIKDVAEQLKRGGENEANNI